MPNEKKEIKTKKRRLRHSAPLSMLSFALSICFFAASFYFLFQTGSEVYAMVSLQKEIQVSEDVLRILKEETANLEIEKVKLEDPKYVKRFARGQFLLTKDGEKIFYLPSK